MNEIEKHTGNQIAINPASSGAISLAEWAAELDSAYKIAQALCATKFAPKEVQGKPEEAAVRMLAGRSVGIDPMSSLNAFYEVHNRPALYARTMVAVAQSQGHQIQRVEATDDSVTYKARRRGDSEWQLFTWTMARAKQAGYTTNAKYKSNPIEMLSAKASAEAVRTIAADALLGMPYSVEELELEDLGETGAPAPAATVKRKTRSKAKTTTKTETKPDPAPEPEPAEEPEPDLPGGVHDTAPITEQTWAEIHELAEQQNVGSVPGWASDQLGRTLTGWKDITEAEGDQLLKLLTTGETQ